MRTDPLEVFFSAISQLSDVLLAWGWLLLLALALWIAWEVYVFLKHVDYTGSIKWTFYELKIPSDSIQTPKSFENAIDVWGGMHKNPDLIESIFEGYFLGWYSLEIFCTKNSARYIMVVPTPHAKFFEGVLYGQYPTIEITEAEDYTLRYSYEEIAKTFEIWGAEIHQAKDDIYPIRTYHEYEDSFNEDNTFIDPHQAMVEAFTNINDGEEFWVQLLVKPIDAKDILKWTDRGQERISELAGEDIEKPAGFFQLLKDALMAWPKDLFSVIFKGPLEPASEDKDFQFRIYNPSQDAEMKAILQKVSRNGYRTKIRVIHIAPQGKLQKPNYGKAIGAFKQFSSWNLNNLYPDPVTKVNGPNYIFKQTRRDYRARAMLLNFQWRDFWGDNSGQMMNAEEIATLYHLPSKYVQAPSVKRASAGVASPPSNVPYV